MAAKAEEKSKFLTYKGKPLVRCGDVIYYGDLADDYVVKLQIKEKEKLQDLDMPSSITVQLINTSADIGTQKKIVKSSEKENMYLAMDIAEIWLSRALSESKKS